MLVRAGIRAPNGVVFVLIDGPPAAWAAHEPAAELIPRLLEFGSALRGPAGS